MIALKTMIALGLYRVKAQWPTQHDWGACINTYDPTPCGCEAPGWYFCNYDNGDEWSDEPTSTCESCDNYSDQWSCDNNGLSWAGADGCKFWCFSSNPETGTYPDDDCKACCGTGHCEDGFQVSDVSIDEDWGLDDDSDCTPCATICIPIYPPEHNWDACKSGYQEEPENPGC